MLQIMKRGNYVFVEKKRKKKVWHRFIFKQTNGLVSIGLTTERYSFNICSVPIFYFSSLSHFLSFSLTLLFVCSFVLSFVRSFLPSDSISVSLCLNLCVCVSNYVRVSNSVSNSVCISLSLFLSCFSLSSFFSFQFQCNVPILWEE